LAALPGLVLAALLVRLLAALVLLAALMLRIGALAPTLLLARLLIGIVLLLLARLVGGFVRIVHDRLLDDGDAQPTLSTRGAAKGSLMEPAAFEASGIRSCRDCGEGVPNDKCWNRRDQTRL
jgi:hypothetical protein